MRRAARAEGLAAALAVRLPGGGVRPVWLDEMYTLFALSRGWGDLVAERMAQGHSPAWFLLMKALPLPDGEVAPPRVLAAVCDSLAAGVLAWGMARHAGWAADAPEVAALAPEAAVRGTPLVAVLTPEVWQRALVAGLAPPDCVEPAAALVVPVWNAGPCRP